MAPSFRIAIGILLLIGNVQLLRTLGQEIPLSKIDRVASQDSIRPFDPAGSLILVGGGSVPPEIRKRIADAGRAGKPDSCLIIIPTSSTYAEIEPAEYWKEPWLDCGFASIEILHTRDREQAETEAFNEPLTRATAVWISGGDQSRFTAAYAGTRTEAMLKDVLNRGGVVSGTSAGAAMASRVMIADGQVEPVIGVGLDLLPRGIVDQHFANRNRLPRLKQAVSQHPDRVGLGIDEATAVVFQRRTMEVLGEGNAHLVFAATEYVSEEVRTIAARSLKNRLLDWTTLIREARERALPSFPAIEVKSDQRRIGIRVGIEKGALLIVGGGRVTPEMWQTFVNKAGGKQAKIVVLPTAMPDPPDNPGPAQIFRNLGVDQVDVLTSVDPEVVNSPETIQILESATGIWFGGGRQWRFVDVYEGTAALQAMHGCLARGGIIGGSSAGASIQGELLIRGAPVGNQIMVQDGYRRGFGFLPGVGIDQHFTQRNRLEDLKQVIRKYPPILGLGIDEETALLIEKSTATVLGQGQVFAIGMQVQGSQEFQTDEPHGFVFGAGRSFDLNQLNRVLK